MDLRSQFIDAMSRAVTGVTVVTTSGPEGRFGQTVSAMASVTADPPTLLVCIKTTSIIVDQIRTNDRFGVNILRSDQRRVADTFAGRSRTGVPYDFDVAHWEEPVLGAPLLVGAVGQFACDLTNAVLVGSHLVMFGEVLAAQTSSGSPLLYARRSYGEHVEVPRQAPPVSFDVDVRLVDEDRQGGFRE
ncbi:MAG TPA: flavin reductase family protein [Thermomicrobiales bacterium]|nr:flavin reductase family protein [Thermomicrobiales bacterium]HRA47284.1 flavin reductase family protein [Thermomicrobiales bacterium]